jgi:hypothetical protein
MSRWALAVSDPEVLDVAAPGSGAVGELAASGASVSRTLCSGVRVARWGARPSSPSET